MLFDEDASALNDDDQTSGGSADTDQTGSDDTSTDGSADDTGADDGTGQDKTDDGTEGDQGTDKTGDKMIPKSRFDEVISERNSERERTQQLQGQVDYLAQMIAKSQSGKDVTDKQQDKAQNALDALIESGQIKKDEATKLQQVIDAMGYKRGDDKPDARVEALEKQVKALTSSLGEQADRKEKDSVLKQYGDLITEDDLDAVMKEWANSRDPELKYAAQHWSYEKIAKLAFHDKIVASEVDKALKGKKKGAPNIDKKAGDKSPKKPQRDDFEWQTGDGATSMEALKRSVLVDVAQDAE